MVLENLIIRPIRKDDFPALHEIVNMPEVAELAGPVPPMTFEIFEKWHGRYIEQPQNIALVAETKKKVIGLVTLSPEEEELHRFDSWLSIYIHKKFWHKGVGTQLMNAVIDVARDIGLKRITLVVFAGNEAAIHMYKKLGFKVEGREEYGIYTLGRYMDTILMGLLVDEDLPKEE